MRIGCIFDHPNFLHTKYVMRLNCIFEFDHTTFFTQCVIWESVVSLISQTFFTQSMLRESIVSLITQTPSHRVFYENWLYLWSPNLIYTGFNMRISCIFDHPNFPHANYVMRIDCVFNHPYSFMQSVTRKSIVSVITQTSFTQSMWWQSSGLLQVKVMYTTPTHNAMQPCKFYLDGHCRFTEDKCR